MQTSKDLLADREFIKADAAYQAAVKAARKARNETWDEATESTSTTIPVVDMDAVGYNK